MDERPLQDIEQLPEEVAPAQVQENVNNVVGGRVWNLVSPDPDNPVKLGYVKISQLSFEGYSDSTHMCIVKDGHGNTVFETQGDTDLTPVMTALGEYIWVWNLTLVHLDSGRVVVHVL